MDSPTRKRTLRQISSLPPFSSDEMKEVTKQIALSDDRHAAIIASAQLDRMLGFAVYFRLSGKYFPKPGWDKISKEDDVKYELLHERDGALSSFYSKISLSYVMGICSKMMYDDLHTVRRIRNAFAHSWKPIAFKTREVADECHKLKCLRSWDYPVPEGLIGDKFSDERLLFVTTCQVFSGMIFTRGRHDHEHEPAVMKLRESAATTAATIPPATAPAPSGSSRKGSPK